MRKLYLVCFALILSIAMILPVSLPTGATLIGDKPLAYVNSFNYENGQNLPYTDGGHVISVTLLPNGTTIGWVKIFDLQNHLEIIGTVFVDEATRFWKEDGASVAEFVVLTNLWGYVKYQIWDHDESGQNDWHRVWMSFNGTDWGEPLTIEYVLGYAQVHLRR
jgi:hypothetical protein